MADQHFAEVRAGEGKAAGASWNIITPSE